jgi:hypothetical protein
VALLFVVTSGKFHIVHLLVECVDGNFNILEEQGFMLCVCFCCAYISATSEVLIESLCEVISPVGLSAQAKMGYNQFCCWGKPF